MKRNEIFKRTIIFLFAQLSNKDQAKVIDAIKESAKLTKADAGRLMSPMPIPVLTGMGLISGMSKAELIDVIKESAKLTKADAG